VQSAAERDAPQHHNQDRQESQRGDMRDGAKDESCGEHRIGLDEQFNQLDLLSY
jgi:hypothetical protein